MNELGISDYINTPIVEKPYELQVLDIARTLVREAHDDEWTDSYLELVFKAAVQAKYGPMNL